MTTTSRLTDAIVQTLTEFLPAVTDSILDAKGRKMPRVKIIRRYRSGEAPRPNEYPAIYVSGMGFKQKYRGPGSDGTNQNVGSAERIYAYDIDFAVLAQPKQRDVETWAEELVDAIVKTLEEHFKLDSTAYPAGAALDSDPHSAEWNAVDAKIGRKTSRLAFGTLRLDVKVIRNASTHGGE